MKRATTLIRFFGAVLLTAAFGLCPPSQAAQEKPGPESLTLDQCISKALGYSPNFKASRDELDSARYAEKEAFTYFLPTLGTSYTWRRVDTAPSMSALGYRIRTGSRNTYKWSAYVRQPIFSGLRITSNYKLAELGVNVAEMNLKLSRLDIVNDVRVAYFEYLNKIKSAAVAAESVNQLKAHLKVSQDFYDVGIIPINDVLKTKVELANAVQNQVSAENDVALARSTLNRLLGNSLNDSLTVVDILQYVPLALTYENAHQTAQAQRPELATLKLRIQQADHSITRARSGYYPQVNLEGTYNSTSDSPEMGDSDYYDPSAWEVAAVLDWPFWEWGRTSHQVSQEKAGKRRLQNLFKDLDDSVNLQVKQAWLFLRESEKNISTASVAVTQAKENYRITNERFKEQLTTNTELLDAQFLLTQSQNQYYNALTVYNVAECRLRRFMGQGQEVPLSATRRGGGKP